MEKIEKVIPSEMGSDRDIIEEGKFFAAVGYFSLLCVVPLLLKRGNSFAEFHGRQALVLFILELAASMLKAVPVLGGIIFSLAWVVFGLASLIAIIKVLSGEHWKMPFVFSIASKMTL